MSGDDHSRVLCSFGIMLLSALVAFLSVDAATPAAAQVHGIPPSVTSIQNHFPPYLPNIPASVTSLGPLGYVGPPAFPVYPNTRPFSGRHGSHGNGYGNKFGYGYNTGAWIVPYYIPAYDDTSGYDVGGAASAPYVYSGPPPEQTLHAVVDLPPARRADQAEGEDMAPIAKIEPSQESEVLPLEATVLIFRDGHEQQVTNYAVMGQTIYVFDARKQKISLSDVDVPATIKANDDRGVDFQLPNPKHS
jgi:hypothetical protein